MEETEALDKNSPEDSELSRDSAPEPPMTHETEHNLSAQYDGEGTSNTIVTAKAIDVACSIAKSCLAQICK